MTFSKTGFLAVIAAAVMVASASAASFEIAVIPDTQNYCDTSKPQPASINLYKTEMQYLADNKTSQNIVFATHVGDVVQHGNLAQYSGEWTNAQSAMDILSASGIPFGMTPGNHDYDNYSYSTGSRPLQGSVGWNNSFGPSSSYFTGKSWYGGASSGVTVNNNAGMSSYQTFSAGGKMYMNISLEMEPSNEAIDWAKGVIAAHPGVPTIVTTHEYLSPATQTRPNDGYMSGNSSSNSPDQIWSKLVAPNDQIFMVLCGHAWTSTDSKGQSNGENLRIDNNNAGHPVYQVLSDLQGNTFDANGTPGVYTGGAGWLRTMTFDTEANTIHFETYSPVLGKYAGKNGENTFGIDASLSDFTLAIPPQAVPEPSTLALMGMGIVGLVAWIRRKQKNG